MPVIKIAHRDAPFVMIRRETIQDESLSWEARGMLAYLLSKPADWEVHPNQLRQGCGRDKVYAILRELGKAGYVARQDMRGEKGRIVDVAYVVYEAPQTSQPFPEKPFTVKPITANPELQSIESHSIETQNIEDTNTPPMAAGVEGQAPILKAKSKRKAQEAPETETPPQPPTPMFRAVARGFFDIADDAVIATLWQTDKDGAARINKIVKWLERTTGVKDKRDDAAALGVVEKLRLMRADFRMKNPNAHPPKDLTKFSEAWRAWESSRKPTPETPRRAAAPAPDAPAPTPETLAQRRAQAQALRENLKGQTS